MEHATSVCVERRKEVMKIPSLRHSDVFYRQVRLRMNYLNFISKNFLFKGFGDRFDIYGFS